MSCSRETIKGKKIKAKKKKKYIRNICMALLLMLYFVGSKISQRKHLETDCLCMLFNIYLNLDFEKD